MEWTELANGRMALYDHNDNLYLEVDSTGSLYDKNGLSVVGSGGSLPVVFSRSGTLTAAAGTGKFPAPRAGRIVKVYAAVGTAPTGASVICDVNLNGTTIFTTQANRPTITAGSQESAAATPDVTTVKEADLLSVDVDQIGASVAGSDLTVVILVA